MIYRTLVSFMLVCILFVFGLGEVWAWKSTNSVNGAGFDIWQYRTLHIAEMVLLVVTVFLIRQRVSARLRFKAAKRQAVSGQRYWLHIATLLGLGLMFATIGNIIAMGFVDLTDIMEPQIMLATPFMIISHFIYIRAMHIVIRSTKFELPNTLKWLAIGACPIIGSLLWFHTIESTSDQIANLMSIFYATILVFMTMQSIWLFMTWGLSGIMISIGGLCLVGSSLLVSMNVYSGINNNFELQQWIWVPYFIGHLMIAMLPMLGFTKRATACDYKLA